VHHSQGVYTVVHFMRHAMSHYTGVRTGCTPCEAYAQHCASSAASSHVLPRLQWFVGSCSRFAHFSLTVLDESVLAAALGVFVAQNYRVSPTAVHWRIAGARAGRALRTHWLDRECLMRRVLRA
jgi:hypothetical protein